MASFLDFSARGSGRQLFEASPRTPNFVRVALRGHPSVGIKYMELLGGAFIITTSFTDRYHDILYPLGASVPYNPSMWNRDVGRLRRVLVITTSFTLLFLPSPAADRW